LAERKTYHKERALADDNTLAAQSERRDLKYTQKEPERGHLNLEVMSCQEELPLEQKHSMIGPKELGS